MMGGVIILMLASLFEKILGVIFKIPLYNLLGSTGMGYFNAAYSIFSTFYTISLTGFPIAVSIMISKSVSSGRVKEVKRIYTVALAVFLSLGIVGSSVMFFGADIIANVIDSANSSSLCIKAIAPILFLICFSSSIRGYFQGHRNMTPTAISEFLDALGKCLLGVVFAIYATSKGYSTPVRAAFAIAGVTAGHLLGLSFLLVFKRIFDKKQDKEGSAECERFRTLLSRLFEIAVPITLSSMALGLTSNIDTFTVMNCLGSKQAMAMYGDYTTLAVTLFRLPQAFITPISSALTPTIASAVEKQDKERAKSAMNSAFKLAAVISVPCAFGMGIFAFPIIYLLFGNGSSAEAIATTAPYLSVLSVGIIFMAALTVTSSVLQSHNLEKKPVIAALFGCLTKLVLNIILVSNIGMIGAPISSALGYFVMAALNFHFVIKYVYPDMKIGAVILKTVLASVIMSAFAVAVYMILYRISSSVKISVLVAVLLAIPTYAVFLLKIRGIDKNDVMMLPYGDRIYNILKKIKLMA